MSNPRNRWYGYIKYSIGQIAKVKAGTSMQDLIFAAAYNEAVEETLKMDDGEMRMQVINRILVKQIATINGEAMRLNYSWRTIQNWQTEFIALCGEKAGYSMK